MTGSRPGPRPVVVLGDVNVDLEIDLPDRSLPVSARVVGEPRAGGGGTAGNAAAALGRLGVPVVFHGAVGDDAFGRLAREGLEAAGVDTRGVVVLPDRSTCQVIAMVEPDGERYLVVWPPDMGALRWLEPADLDAGLIRSASWLHTTGMCLRHAPVRDAVLTAMADARAAAVPVSLDCNLRLELWGLEPEVAGAVEAAVALADVVLGSGVEEIVPLARALGATVSSPEEAAGALADGVRTVIARLGADGALAVNASGELVRAPGIPVAARSTVGAGDAFDGGFIAARAAGLPLGEALRWGNAAGAWKVAHGGGARTLADREGLGALLAASASGDDVTG